MATPDHNPDQSKFDLVNQGELDVAQSTGDLELTLKVGAEHEAWERNLSSEQQLLRLDRGTYELAESLYADLAIALTSGTGAHNVLDRLEALREKSELLEAEHRGFTPARPVHDARLSLQDLADLDYINRSGNRKAGHAASKSRHEQGDSNKVLKGEAARGRGEGKALAKADVKARRLFQYFGESLRDLEVRLRSQLVPEGEEDPIQTMTDKFRAPKLADQYAEMAAKMMDCEPDEVNFAQVDQEKLIEKALLADHSRYELAATRFAKGKTASQPHPKKSRADVVRELDIIARYLPERFGITRSDVA